MNNGSLWLIIFIITLVVEALTTSLVSIWFSIGALSSFITSYITDNTLIQIIVFVITSVIALIITKPIIKKYIKKDIIKTNCNNLIGKFALVTEEVTDKNIGKVKVDGQIWSALNKDKGTIDADSEVEVLSIEGVKLIVRKKDE